MLNAIVAALAGSQTKLMGVIGGISLLINQFRHEISIWLSDLLGHSVRPEILDVAFFLFTVAMMITVIVAFMLYVAKSIARAGKANRLARQFASAHLGAVSTMSEATKGDDFAAPLRTSLTELVHQVEFLQKKSKRLRKRNPEMEAAYADYVQKLEIFSAAVGGARVSDEQPVEPNLAELTEAAFALLSAFGYVEKGRKFRKQKTATRASAAEVDHALRAMMDKKAPVKIKVEAEDKAVPSEPEAPAAPDVIVRTQTARAGQRMSRRQRRKLGPWDQPGGSVPTKSRDD